MKTQTKFQREKPLFRDRPEYKCIGYARQSTNKQISIGAQHEELKKAGCVVVFQETVSSADKAFSGLIRVVITPNKLQKAIVGDGDALSPEQMRERFSDLIAEVTEALPSDKVRIIVKDEEEDD